MRGKKNTHLQVFLCGVKTWDDMLGVAQSAFGLSSNPTLWPQNSYGIYSRLFFLLESPLYSIAMNWQYDPQLETKHGQFA